MLPKRVTLPRKIKLLKGGMTEGEVREHIEAVQGRYVKGNRKEQGRILDEVTKVTGYYRKAVIGLLGGWGKGKPVGWRGRAGQYGPEVVYDLRTGGEASTGCAQRGRNPFCRSWREVLERHGELTWRGR